MKKKTIYFKGLISIEKSLLPYLEINVAFFIVNCSMMFHLIEVNYPNEPFLMNMNVTQGLKVHLHEISMTQKALVSFVLILLDFNFNIHLSCQRDASSITRLP